MTVSRIGTPLPDDRDWVTASELTAAANITYRQLDYWCRTGLLTATQRRPGTGNDRHFGLDQVDRARVVAALYDAGRWLWLDPTIVDDLLAGEALDIGPLTLTVQETP